MQALCLADSDPVCKQAKWPRTKWLTDGLGVPLDDVEDAIGDARPVAQLRQGQRCQGRRLCRLQDDLRPCPTPTTSAAAAAHKSNTKRTTVQVSTHCPRLSFVRHDEDLVALYVAQSGSSAPRECAATLRKAGTTPQQLQGWGTAGWGYSSWVLRTVQPTARAGATLRVIMLMGKFQGVMAATTPTGCLITIMRRSLCTVCRTSPVTLRHSSANHSIDATLHTRHTPMSDRKSERLR